MTTITLNAPKTTLNKTTNNKTTIKLNLNMPKTKRARRTTPRLTAVNNNTYKTSPEVSFTFYSDPKGGWLAVNISDFMSLGLTLNNLTPKSVINNNTLYLEGKTDFPLFFNTYCRIMGEEPTINSKHYNNRGPFHNYKSVKSVRVITEEITTYNYTVV